MSEDESLCWHCREVRTCLQATARGTVACPAYEQQPYPPGPPRPPIGTYCADRLWANTPEHLRPKSQDEHRDERIKSLKTTILEQADQIEALSAERERYRMENTELRVSLRVAEAKARSGVARIKIKMRDGLKHLVEIPYSFWAGPHDPLDFTIASKDTSGQGTIKWGDGSWMWVNNTTTKILEAFLTMRTNQATLEAENKQQAARIDVLEWDADGYCRNDMCKSHRDKGHWPSCYAYRCAVGEK